MNKKKLLACYILNVIHPPFLLCFIHINVYIWTSELTLCRGHYLKCQTSKPYNSFFSDLHTQIITLMIHFRDFRLRVIVRSVEGNAFFFSFYYLVSCVSHFVHSEPGRKISFEPYRNNSSYICTYSVGASP